LIVVMVMVKLEKAAQVLGAGTHAMVALADAVAPQAALAPR
jgi:hypothetical protein